MDANTAEATALIPEEKRGELAALLHDLTTIIEDAEFLQKLEESIQSLKGSPDGDPGQREAITHLEALRDEVRASMARAAEAASDTLTALDGQRTPPQTGPPPKRTPKKSRGKKTG